MEREQRGNGEGRLRCEPEPARQHEEKRHAGEVKDDIRRVVALRVESPQRVIDEHRREEHGALAVDDVRLPQRAER